MDCYSPDLYNDLPSTQQAIFAGASIVAWSTDPSQVSSNGRKHPDEKSTDEDFFGKYPKAIVAQYIENLEFGG